MNMKGFLKKDTSHVRGSSISKVKVLLANGQTKMIKLKTKDDIFLAYVQKEDDHEWANREETINPPTPIQKVIKLTLPAIYAFMREIMP